jgi:RimJ/RimL family protein N-acetyltransferase
MMIFCELFNKKRSNLHKATCDGRLIGFACAGVDMHQRTGWLLFSNVSREFQGQGLGKRLIEARLQALRQFPHLQEVLVTVSPANTPSIRALERFGFHLRRTEADYYGPGKHRDILALPVATALSKADLLVLEEMAVV